MSGIEGEANDRHAEPTTWLNQRERGSLLGMRIAFSLATLLGRGPMKLLVHAVALWYRLFDRRSVRASRDWLTRVDGARPGFWRIYRHIRLFCQVTLDRVFLLKGRTRMFQVATNGRELLHAQRESGRGAVLLGAHLGSYEAMRASGEVEEMPINIVGYFENARMINALLESMNPESAARVIHIGKDPIGSVTRIAERIEAGEMVALLGDRVGLNDRVVRARFFGEQAPFAAGPFLLAAALRCPVYMTFGLYHDPNRYDLYCELFAERIDLPRGERQAALSRWVQQYAERLEVYCRRAPDNWFNFFDFWSSP